MTGCAATAWPWGGVPLGKVAKRRGDQPAVGGRLLDIQRLPPQHGPFDVGAHGRLRIQSQQAQRTVAMMAEVGVDAHVAVGAWVQAGKRIPQFGHLAVQREPTGTFGGGVGGVDRHALAGHTARMAQFAGGQRRRGDADLRGACHGK